MDFEAPKRKRGRPPGTGKRQRAAAEAAKETQNQQELFHNAVEASIDSKIQALAGLSKGVEIPSNLLLPEAELVIEDSPQIVIPLVPREGNYSPIPVNLAHASPFGIIPKSGANSRPLVERVEDEPIVSFTIYDFGTRKLTYRGPLPDEHEGAVYWALLNRAMGLELGDTVRVDNLASFFKLIYGDKDSGSSYERCFKSLKRLYAAELIGTAHIGNQTITSHFRFISRFRHSKGDTEREPFKWFEVTLDPEARDEFKQFSYLNLDDRLKLKKKLARALLPHVVSQRVGQRVQRSFRTLYQKARYHGNFRSFVKELLPALLELSENNIVAFDPNTSFDPDRERVEYTRLR